ncbi:MAG: hypothetical protein U0768_13165 [Anaerolineae bacterium]
MRAALQRREGRRQVLDQTAYTIFANSFSKIFRAASRLGYVYADDPSSASQATPRLATNSHASLISQALCAEFFNRGLYDAHLRADLRYSPRTPRCDDGVLSQTELPQEVKSVYPDGGSVHLRELPELIDTTALLSDAIAQKVMYMPREAASSLVEGQLIRNNRMRSASAASPREKIQWHAPPGERRFARL